MDSVLLNIPNRQMFNCYQAPLSGIAPCALREVYACVVEPQRQVIPMLRIVVMLIKGKINKPIDIS